MKKAIALIALIISFAANAQLTQTIRGTVRDEILQKPIEGASVIIAATKNGVITDAAGNFRLKNVPVGIVTLVVSYVGYKENIVSNITVNTGKEIVLNIDMQERVNTNTEVVVKADSKKNRPLNDMSVV